MINFPDFTSGDSLTFKTIYRRHHWEDWDSEDFNLSFVLASGATIVTFSSVANTDGCGGWITTIQPPESNLAAGLYSWQAILTAISDSTDHQAIGAGQVKVLPNLASVPSNYDPRSPNEITLANIRAAIQNLMSGGAIQEYRIEGRLRHNYTLAELIQLESRYVQLVAIEKNQERIKNGLPNADNIKIRFRPDNPGGYGGYYGGRYY